MVWITKDEAHEFTTIADLMRITGCGETTARRWKKSPKLIPESARRLIGYHVCHDLAILWGKDWEHFQFHSGKLFAPSWREGFTPQKILFMFYQIQDVGYLRSQVRTLTADLEREKARCEVLERDNQFYRRQVSLESRFGMMLERVFA